VLNVPTTVATGSFSATLLLLSSMSVGPSLISVTLMVKSLSKVRLPLSVTLIVTWWLVAVSKSSAPSTRSSLPTIANLLSGSSTSPNVNVSSGSGSIVDNVPITVPTNEFSSTILFESKISVGDWLVTNGAENSDVLPAGSVAVELRT